MVNYQRTQIEPRPPNLVSRLCIRPSLVLRVHRTRARVVFLS